MSKSSRTKWGIALIVWPLAALILSFLLFALVNWALSGDTSQSDVGTTIVNILLFIVGASAVGLGLPSVIVGIILLATPGASIPAQFTQMPQTSVSNGSEKGNGMSIAGMILGISSVVFFWFLGFILGIMAIIFSSIGLKRKKTKGLAVTGLVTGIIGTILSLIVGVGLIIASYAGITERANDSMIKSNAYTVQKQAELFYAESDRYPSLAEVTNEVEAVDSEIIIGSQGAEVSEDIIYIPCYGEGAIIWHWDAVIEEYETIEMGLTDSCEWNE